MPTGQHDAPTKGQSPVADLDDGQVMRYVEHAKRVFEKLTRLSPELAAIASDKTLRISVMSDYSERAIEVCRFVNGRIEWKVKGKGVNEPEN